MIWDDMAMARHHPFCGGQLVVEPYGIMSWHVQNEGFGGSRTEAPKHESWENRTCAMQLMRLAFLVSDLSTL